MAAAVPKPILDRSKIKRTNINEKLDMANVAPKEAPSF